MQLTRNQPYLYGYRGFESLPLRHSFRTNLRFMTQCAENSALPLFAPRGRLRGFWPSAPVESYDHNRRRNSEATSLAAWRPMSAREATIYIGIVPCSGLMAAPARGLPGLKFQVLAR